MNCRLQIIYLAHDNQYLSISGLLVFSFNAPPFPWRKFIGAKKEIPWFHCSRSNEGKIPQSANFWRSPQMSRQNIPLSALKSSIYTLRCLPKRNVCLAYLLQDGFAIYRLFFFLLWNSKLNICYLWNLYMLQSRSCIFSCRIYRPSQSLWQPPFFRTRGNIV